METNHVYVVIRQWAIAPDPRGHYGIQGVFRSRIEAVKSVLDLPMRDGKAWTTFYPVPDSAEAQWASGDLNTSGGPGYDSVKVEFREIR